MKPSLINIEVQIDVHRLQPHHIPTLCDLKDYQAWNEKLARKINYMHTLYKRFVNRYALRQPQPETQNLRATDYSGDIMKHLINYCEDTDVRFFHEDMKSFDTEILSIVQLFEGFDGQNPFRPQSDKPNEQNEAVSYSGEGEDQIENNYDQDSEVNNPDFGKFLQK